MQASVVVVRGTVRCRKWYERFGEQYGDAGCGKGGARAWKWSNPSAVGQRSKKCGMLAGAKSNVHEIALIVSDTTSCSVSS